VKPYPTAYLERHAADYAAALMHKHNVTLEQYLAEPTRYEHLLTAPFPLLPAQTRVRVSLINDERHQETLARLEQMVREAKEMEAAKARRRARLATRGMAKVLAFPNKQPTP